MGSSSRALARAALTLGRLREQAIDTVYPPRCAGCGRRGWWVCNECLPRAQALARPWCDRCGAPVNAEDGCAGLHPALRVVRSAVWYEGWPRKAITQFKYEGESARARHLAELLVPMVDDFPADAMLTPVPLHRRRERDRGYNQAAFLAEALARPTGRHTSQVLARAEETRQQVGLAAEQRRANVLGAFAIREGADARGRSFVLIDDVMTTGATLGECAAVLDRAGAAFVGALTVARDR